MKSNCAHNCSCFSSLSAPCTNEKMDIFVVGFWILTVICIALFVYTHSSKTTAVAGASDSNFKAFQRLYLIVYLLAMGNLFR